MRMRIKKYGTGWANLKKYIKKKCKGKNWILLKTINTKKLDIVTTNWKNLKVSGS